MADQQVRYYSIRNHLGCEVGEVQTNSDNPVAAYAVLCQVKYSLLKSLGYTAVEVT